MNEIIKWLLDPSGKSVVTYRIVLLALIAWMAMGGNFVGKSAYEADKSAQLAVNAKVSASLENINVTLLLMKEQHKVDAAQNKVIEDHETRMRILEQSRRQ